LRNFNAARLDQLRILRARCAYAALGVIHTAHYSLCGSPSQLLDRPAAATTHVQNREMLVDWNVLQPPIGHAGMGQVHHPYKNPAHPFCGLSDLIQHVKQQRS